MTIHSAQMSNTRQRNTQGAMNVGPKDGARQNGGTQQTERVPRLASIKQAVSDVTGCPVHEIVGRSRRLVNVKPRQLVILLMHQKTNLSLAEIGRALGGRDHTTIIQGIESAQKRLSKDADYRADYSTACDAIDRMTAPPMFTSARGKQTHNDEDILRWPFACKGGDATRVAELEKIIARLMLEARKKDKRAGPMGKLPSTVRDAVAQASERKDKILAAMAPGPNYAPDIATATGFNPSAVNDVLIRLSLDGLVRREQIGKTRYWVWFLEGSEA